MFISFRFPMKKLHREKDILVYLPDNYDEKKHYPVLYIQDGQNAFFNETSYSKVSWGFIECMKELKLDIIMVSIPCIFNDDDRMNEYGPWKINKEMSYYHTHIKDKIIGGEGDLYCKWLIEELKPYIDQRFSTNDDNGIIGSSMAAVLSAYACLKYPHIFKKAACLSTAFWFYTEEFDNLIKNMNDYPDKFYFDVGQYEGCGNSHTDQLYLDSNQRIYELLKDKMNISYKYIEKATHNEKAWRERLPEAIQYLYGGDYGIQINRK